VGLVLLDNVECAAAFLLNPEIYLAGFGLSGVVGASMVRGMGILFLMWNVPYAFAFLHPAKRAVSLYEAVIMQGIGLAGETWLSTLIPASQDLIRQTLQRFILFDGAGLAALLLAVLLVRKAARQD
jgi:hypothetical protein